MSDFLVDINPEIEFPKYELVLTKLTEEPITSLKNITDLDYNAFYIGIDELNFNIPFYRMEDNGNKVENEIYNLIEGNHLILVNDMKYFIINNVVEKADESGKVWKEVQCYSREYELSKKKLIDYKADSRVLYDDTNSMLDGLEKGILNYIFNHIVKSWTIGYVDPDVILREGKGIYRSLNFPNSNLIQVFKDLQRTYRCVFKFDTIKQEINIYSIDKMMRQHRGLYISDGNFIKNISKDIKTDGIITRLYVYGKDNVSIQSISPTGQPYIDNFNYYKNTLDENGQPKYMTRGLIDAFDRYYEKVANYNPDFEPLLIRLQEANAVMEDLYNTDHIDDLNQKGLIALERYLSNLQTLIDVKVEEIAIIQNQIAKATGENLISLYDDLKAKQTILDGYNTGKDNVNKLITTKKIEIDNQQQVIDGIEAELKTLQDELSVSNSTNFTTEQLKELDNFIKVDIYNNSDYTENNIQELYEEGKKILDKASQPKIQFEVDVVDFLNVIECQHMWDKFVLGDIVTLEHKEIGFNYDVRLVGYEHGIDNNNLTLKFSNMDSFDDATLYLEQLLDDFNTTGAVVDFNKDNWDNVGNVESRIAKLVDTKLEEARQNILNAVGQRYLFDDSGLWLYKENPDGTLNPEQIRAINNTIALTEDNWNTVGTAITPEGVNAQYIRGKLGEFTKVSADQIEVGSSEQPLLEYIDEQNKNITVHQILLSNENQSIITDSKGIITTSTIVQTNIDVYKGITKVDATIGDVVLKNNDGNTISFGTIIETNPTTTSSGSVVWSIPANTDISSESGWIEIPISVEGKAYTKKLTWNKARAGEKGDRGEDGAQGKDGVQGKDGHDAKVVKITASHSAFISKNMNNPSLGSSYEPSSITLKADFQNCMPNSHPWLYSRDGDAFCYVSSGSNGLTIDGNNLIIENTSSLYSSTQTSVIFKAKSTTEEYDLITIPRLFDTTTLAENAVKQNFSYNNTKITEKEGIEVYDNLGRRVLQVGGIDTTGNNIKNAYGFKATHSDGTFSAMVGDGFIRKWSYGEGKYLNDIHVGLYESTGSGFVNPPPYTRIDLPQSFRGRKNVEVFTSLVDFWFSIGEVDKYGDLRYGITNSISLINKVVEINLSGSTPYVKLDIYKRFDYQNKNGEWQDSIFDPLNFILIVIGS